jgi:hypothetical protein
MSEPEVPVVHTLLRPISMARIQTVDWDELRDLAELADRAGAALGYGVTYADDYAAGVRDALRWLADGVPTTALLQLLGGR